MRRRSAARTRAPVGSAALIAALAAALSACTGGLRSHAAPTVAYVLRAAPAGQPGQTPDAIHASLRVLRPLAAPGLDSDHIALARADRRLTWYAASRWAAPMPDVVESLAVETLRGTGMWQSIEDSRGIVAADYFLEIGIRRFEADGASGSGPPVIHVALDCTLGRSESRALVSSFTIEREETAAENRLGPVVAAFERAADEALAEAARRAGTAARATRTSRHRASETRDQKSDSPVASISR